MSIAAALHEKAITLGRLSVQMTTRAGSGHPSSALSLAHLVTHLMYRQMRFDPADPRNPAADRLVLSEGHAVPVIYAAYADLGGVVGGKDGTLQELKVSDLDGLRARESVLDGHPNPAEGFPFFDAATGSLGQGLSVAAGLALAARQDKTGRRVYCLIGDGESREGQIWEAVDFIADHQLTNVCAIFNCNGQGQAAAVSHQQSPGRIAAKLEAFGWNVAIVDGHDPLEIERAFSEMDEKDRPLAIVAKTVKGWGVEPLLHGNWHGKPLSADRLSEADESLEKRFATLVANSPRRAELSGPAGIARAKPVSWPDVKGVSWPSFHDGLQGAGLGKVLETGKLATRRAYGAALKVAGDLLPQVMALDGDVSNSTFSSLFAKTHADRFVECKIAEQNMVSVAAGLSAAGHIPFVNSFAKFISRAYDQIEMASISRANIKLVGSHAGVSLAADGPSQMGLLDVAYFRAFTMVRGDDRQSPACWVFQPADGVAAYHCTRLMTELRGMCYMRTHRPDVPLLYEPETTFEPGGFHVLRSGDDLAIVTAGYMVHVAKEAAELLAQRQVQASVVDAYSLPLNAERLAETLQRSGRRALVVEDNYDGLGGAIAEIAADVGGLRVATLCCQRIPKSALTPADELDYCGVGATQIVERALTVLERSR